MGKISHVSIKIIDSSKQQDDQGPCQTIKIICTMFQQVRWVRAGLYSQHAWQGARRTAGAVGGGAPLRLRSQTGPDSNEPSANEWLWDLDTLLDLCKTLVYPSVM